MFGAVCQCANEMFKREKGYEYEIILLLRIKLQTIVNVAYKYSWKNIKFVILTLMFENSIL